jgi:DUF2945 family protein
VKSFRKGDRVTWSSHGGTATGEVVRKITRPPPAAAPYEPAKRTRSTWCAATMAAKPCTIRTRYVAPSSIGPHTISRSWHARAGLACSQLESHDHTFGTRPFDAAEA